MADKPTPGPSFKGVPIDQEGNFQIEVIEGRAEDSFQRHKCFIHMGLRSNKLNSSIWFSQKIHRLCEGQSEA